jgi:hypothetical protein
MKKLPAREAPSVAARPDHTMKCASTTLNIQAAKDQTILDGEFESILKRQWLPQIRYLAEQLCLGMSGPFEVRSLHSERAASSPTPAPVYGKG